MSNVADSCARSDLYLATALSHSGDSRSVAIKAGVIGTAVAVGAIGAALI
jgi:hypothetical protein